MEFILMGRWPSKEERTKRAKRIVELREEKHMQFSDIAKRMNISASIVERVYHQTREKIYD